MRRLSVLVFPACIALLIAGDQTWRDKRVAEWSEEDARRVLDDSPWAKTVTPLCTPACTIFKKRRGFLTETSSEVI